MRYQLIVLNQFGASTKDDGEVATKPIGEFSVFEAAMHYGQRVAGWNYFCVFDFESQRKYMASTHERIEFIRSLNDWKMRKTLEDFWCPIWV